jgi:hypothetical protein
MQAFRLYEALRQGDRELFLSLRTIRLTEQEAEALYVRLQYLDEALPQLRNQLA